MEHIALDEVDSTNDRALEMWRTRAAPSPFFVSARTQTAGVGRQGRPWHSPPGGGWLTRAWPMLADPALYAPLPLLVGLAVRDAIAAQTAAEGQIKWPNDVLIADKKVAGVLCRAELIPGRPLMLIGVGINAAFPAAHLAPGLRQPATTLLDETGRSPDVTALARAVAAHIADAARELESRRLASLLPRARRHLAWLNQPVTCTDARGETLAAGLFRGVDGQGAALIESAGHRRPIAIGELHFSRAK